MVVGVLRLVVYLPENHSLKGKRGVLRKIKAQVSNNFNVSISEAEDQDLWQRSTLGVSQVGTDQGQVDGALRAVVKFIESMGLVEVGEEQFETTARILTGAERARAFEQAVEVFPPYGEFQKKTPREIPVIALQRPSSKG